MPASRKIATSGILIRWAMNAASVPIASTSPHRERVLRAISVEEEVSISTQELEA
jgi:hypothetical protein